METNERHWKLPKSSRRSLLGGALAAGIGYSGLSPASATTATAQTGREITVIQAEDVSTMDPHLDWTVAGRNIYYQMFGTLALGDSELVIQPDLAESWEYLTDRELQLNLRQGVTFHNGEAVNSETIKYSLERILNPDTASPWIAAIGMIENIETPDEYTVIVTSDVPNATFLAEIGRMAIVPPGYIEEVGPEGFAANPVGTGPFRFVEWVVGEHVALEANPDYWNGQPAVPAVKIKAVPENLTRVTELLTGGADIVAKVPPELVVEVENSGTNHISSVTSVQNVFVGMTALEGPFSDQKVRQAVNHAIDVDLLIEAILGDYARKVVGPFSPLIYGVDTGITGYTYDPDQARTLLAEAGYADGFDTELTFGQGRIVKAQELAEAIASELGNVGIRVQVVPREWGVFWDLHGAGSLEGMYLDSLTATIGDPDQVLKFLDSARNGYYFHTPELDALIAEQQQETDEERRVELIVETQQMVIDLAPWAFLFDLDLLYGVNNEITYNPRPNELIWLADVTFGEGEE